MFVKERPLINTVKLASIFHFLFGGWTLTKTFRIHVKLGFANCCYEQNKVDFRFGYDLDIDVFSCSFAELMDHSKKARHHENGRKKLECICCL